MSNYNTNVFLLDKIKNLNISPIGKKNIIENKKKYFLIYLWNKIKQETSQIFLQINNLKILDIEDDIITLNLNKDQLKKFDILEKNIINIFENESKNFIEENSNITFISLVNQKNEQISIKLKIKYNDYDTKIFDYNKEETTEINNDEMMSRLLKICP